MKIVSLLKSGLKNLYFSLKRFPLAISFSTAAALILIFLTNSSSDLSSAVEEILIRITMTIALGFPLYLSLNLLFDRIEKIKTSSKNIIRILLAALLVLYYFLLLTDFTVVSISRYIALNLAFYLTFLFTPYFYNRKNFVLYVVKIFSRFFVTFIFSAVLYLGLAAIFFTVNKLLNIPVTEELYISTWLVVAGIFAPIFLLAEVPEYREEMRPTDYPKLLEVLLLYIVMPLISAYTSILYIYFIKILITRQWPEGLVSHLVLWYSVLSLIVIFFISPLKNKNRWVQKFICWFPRLVLPLLAMMFTAMGIRINAYGVTENRYYVLLLGLWSLLMMVYLIFSRKTRNIIMPVSLALIAVLAVFGPWSSFSISIYSQNQRFSDILNKYEMISEQGITRPVEIIKLEDQQEINGIISYFKNNHQFTDLKYLPRNFTLKDMEKIFGFPYRYSRYSSRKYFYHTQQLERPLNISNYDYLFQIHSNNHSDSDYLQSISRLGVNYNNQSMILKINYQNQAIFEDSLLDTMQKVNQLYDSKEKNQVTQQDLTFYQENDRLKLKLIFSQLTGSEDQITGKITINNLNFYLLVKLK